jgi:uncharacterized protein
MKTNIACFSVGLLFAIGLCLSGMAQPAKIIGFLDISGNWDPTLLFTMGGAFSVHAVTYRIIRKRKRPLLSPNWHIPVSRAINPRLIFGSMIFGVGWGLGGYCPTPTVVSFASLESRPLVVFISLIFGMILYKLSIRNHGFKRNA